MTGDRDETGHIRERVRAAAADAVPLAVRGTGSKDFLGRAGHGEPLTIGGHAGIVHYEPTELMLTVRAGTRLTAIDATLAECGQMLAFDPPRFGGDGTIGGAVAAGLAGPGRPFAGAVRDHVLGVRAVDGHGEMNRFGGEVMKNVAGYDVSRLMAGSLGTLGVLTEVSVKVLPRPARERTVRLAIEAGALYRHVEDTLRQGTPVSAAAHDGEYAYIRLGGAASAVDAGAARLGGERVDDAFWADLRDHHLPLFDPARDDTPLWRIALPPGRPLPGVDGEAIVDWAGQQVWLRTAEPAERLRARVAEAGGHATRLRGADDGTEPFTPPAPALMRIHRRLKQAMDPAGILNPGRLYADL